MSGHARMSPSRLHRIISCPASFRFAEAVEKKHPEMANRTSSYADHGTYLHEVIRRVLEDGVPLGQFDLTIDDTAAIRDALLYYKNLKCAIDVQQEHFETFVALQGYHKELNLTSGTADVVLQTKTKLIVVDWKFGSGIGVKAESNPQLRAYAAGYAKDWVTLSRYKKVEYHIVQPFRDNYDKETISSQALRMWLKEILIPKVIEAKSNNAEFNPSLETCRFCPGKPYCRHRFKNANEVAQKVFKVRKRMDMVSDEELSDLLKQAPVFESYIADTRKHFYLKLTSGIPVKDFKLVEGRSTRKWAKSEDQVVKVLGKYLDFDEMYKSKMVSPAQAEKMSRELRDSEEFKQLVEKPRGKPIMVPESDRRPAYNAESVFANLKQGGEKF